MIIRSARCGFTTSTVVLWDLLSFLQPVSYSIIQLASACFLPFLKAGSISYLTEYSKHSICTASQSNQHLARYWLQHCKTHHERCRSNFLPSSDFPTRLLEIVSTKGEPNIRLIETKHHAREGEYMALSYCWGKAKFCTLRKHNLTRFKEGIRLSTLPKTFQDAVEIVRWFQIRYLWIDSLCIL